MLYAYEWIRHGISLEGRVSDSRIWVFRPSSHFFSNLPFMWCPMIVQLYERHFVGWRRKDFFHTVFAVEVKCAISAPLLSHCSALNVPRPLSSVLLLKIIQESLKKEDCSEWRIFIADINQCKQKRQGRGRNLTQMQGNEYFPSKVKPLIGKQRKHLGFLGRGIIHLRLPVSFRRRRHLYLSIQCHTEQLTNNWNLSFNFGQVRSETNIKSREQRNIRSSKSENDFQLVQNSNSSLICCCSVLIIWDQRAKFASFITTLECKHTFRFISHCQQLTHAQISSLCIIFCFLLSVFECFFFCCHQSNFWIRNIERQVQQSNGAKISKLVNDRTDCGVVLCGNRNHYLHFLAYFSFFVSLNSFQENVICRQNERCSLILVLCDLIVFQHIYHLLHLGLQLSNCFLTVFSNCSQLHGQDCNIWRNLKSR